MNLESHFSGYDHGHLCSVEDGAQDEGWAPTSLGPHGTEQQGGRPLHCPVGATSGPSDCVLQLSPSSGGCGSSHFLLLSSLSSEWLALGCGRLQATFSGGLGWHAGHFSLPYEDYEYGEEMTHPGMDQKKVFPHVWCLVWTMIRG